MIHDSLDDYPLVIQHGTPENPTLYLPRQTEKQRCYLCLPIFIGQHGYGSKFKTWEHHRPLSALMMNHPIVVPNFDPYPIRWAVAWVITIQFRNLRLGMRVPVRQLSTGLPASVLLEVPMYQDSEDWSGQGQPKHHVHVHKYTPFYTNIVTYTMLLCNVQMHVYLCMYRVYIDIDTGIYNDINTYTIIYILNIRS